MKGLAAGKILPACAALALILFWKNISSFLTVKSGFELDNIPVPSGREFIVTGARFLRVGADGAELEMRVDRVVKKAGREMRLDGVVARHLAGGGVTTLQAAAGAYDDKAGLLHLSGGVEMRTADGYLVRTEAARYESRRNRISSRAGVEMSGPSARVRGGGFEFFPDQGLLRLDGGVRCLIETDVITGAAP